MRNLSDLLNRFSHSLKKDSLAKERVREVLLRHTGVMIKEDQIYIKDGVLELDLPPVAKSEIMLKEEAIRDELKGLVGRILYR